MTDLPECSQFFSLAGPLKVFSEGRDGYWLKSVSYTFWTDSVFIYDLTLIQYNPTFYLPFPVRLEYRGIFFQAQYMEQQVPDPYVYDGATRIRFNNFPREVNVDLKMVGWAPGKFHREIRDWEHSLMADGSVIWMYRDWLMDHEMDFPAGLREFPVWKRVFDGVDTVLPSMQDQA